MTSRATDAGGRRAPAQPAAVHPTTLAFAQPPPAEVEVDAPLELAFRVACPHGCDLRGLPVEIAAGERLLASGSLAERDGPANVSGAIELRAPRRTGEHDWTARFAGHEAGGAAHAASALPIRLRTVPHACSVNAWGPSGPVAAGGALEVHVGVRCVRGCRLTGARVALLDAAGATVGAGMLGRQPWPGTEALYWTAVSARAPAAEGVHAWTAVLTDASTELPHAAPPAAFGLRTGRPCEHRAAVRVVEAASRAPVAGVHVRIGPYEAATAADGVATVAVPAGVFEVSIRKDGFRARPLPLTVDRDLTLDIEARTAPTQAELRERAIRSFPWG